jgi:hypothetical protein
MNPTPQQSAPFTAALGSEISFHGEFAASLLFFASGALHTTLLAAVAGRPNVFAPCRAGRRERPSMVALDEEQSP